jgi:hypothetical protein
MQPASLRLDKALRAMVVPLVSALLLGAAAWQAASAATPGRPVQTETIIVPGDKQGADAMPSVPPGSATAPPAAAANTEIPKVEYDFSKLPEAVARTRKAIIDAAATGDLEKLRPIITKQGEPPLLGDDEEGDPIAYLKTLAGDDGGREILAILIEVLDAGYVHVDVGTPDEVYLWPYFARYPIDKLTPPQLVELFKLVYAGDYEDMKADGAYTWYRAGFGADGSWRYFLSGD